MRRRYVVTGILTTDDDFDGTTTVEAKEALDSVIQAGLEQTTFTNPVETFEVKAVQEDQDFVG